MIAGDICISAYAHSTILFVNCSVFSSYVCVQCSHLFTHTLRPFFLIQNRNFLDSWKKRKEKKKIRVRHGMLILVHVKHYNSIKPSSNTYLNLFIFRLKFARFIIKSVGHRSSPISQRQTRGFSLHICLFNWWLSYSYFAKASLANIAILKEIWTWTEQISNRKHRISKALLA